MQRMVADGEVDHLVPERVWQELSRGLMEAAPSRMLETLRACGYACCCPRSRCSSVYTPSGPITIPKSIPARTSCSPSIARRGARRHAGALRGAAARSGAERGSGGRLAAPSWARGTRSGVRRCGQRAPARPGRMPRRGPSYGALPRRHPAGARNCGPRRWSSCSKSTMPCAVPSALLWSLTPVPAIFHGQAGWEAQPLRGADPVSRCAGRRAACRRRCDCPRLR